MNECQAVTAQKDLKNCTKTMMPKVHTKDVYECKDVTKQHCTTVWEIIKGKKVWTGNNDCKNVTWEECKAVKKDVTFLVPVMECETESHDYMDYEQQARPDQARATECEVKAEQDILSRKRAFTTFLSQKFMITRSSIAFEDFLGSSIAPQVMPPCQTPKMALGVPKSKF